MPQLRNSTADGLGVSGSGFRVSGSVDVQNPDNACVLCMLLPRFLFLSLSIMMIIAVLPVLQLLLLRQLSEPEPHGV